MRLTETQLDEYRTLIDSGVEVVDDHVIRNQFISTRNVALRISLRITIISPMLSVRYTETTLTY